jgi:NADH:ubiquinone reductase (H+-translocating)
MTPNRFLDIGVLYKHLLLVKIFTYSYTLTMRLLQDRHHQKRVLILGAGYAGLSALHRLKSQKNLDVTLIDRNPFHTIITELHEAAAHNHDITLPLEPFLGRARFFPAAVQQVNLETRTVQTSNGSLGYDCLLVALGSTTNFFRITGLAEHALQLKSLEDATTIHKRFTAMHHPSQPEQHVVIGGAGLSGVELATELATRAATLAHGKVQIHLLEAGSHILPSLEPRLRQSAQAALEQLGVKLHLGQRLVEATANSVKLENGTELPSSLTVWTGGVRAADVIQGQHLERGVGNRLVVEATLELKGYPNVFVAGDMALALGADAAPVPTTAQHAGQQGAVAADNLLARVRGLPLRDYKPSTIGELVSLGGWLGVGWVKLPFGQRLRLLGALASLVKRASLWKHQLKARGLL